MPVWLRTFLLHLLAVPAPLAAQHTLVGIVRDSATGNPVAEAVIGTHGFERVAVSLASGRFELDSLPSGRVDVTVRRVGYLPVVLEGVRLPLMQPLEVTLASPFHPRTVEELLVRGERTTDLAAPLARVVTGEDAAARPFLGEDAYRVLTRTAGIAADEVSARFRVRGAEQEEVLVRLDGMTLIEPFHLKDLSGTFSVVDGHWIARSTVAPAGFGAQYGNRTAGVVEFVSHDAAPADGRVFASVSPTHARLATAGMWDGGRVGWLLSARRGIPELVLGLTAQGATLAPGYSDGLAKLTFAPSPAHTLSAHFLLGIDRLRLVQDQGRILVHSRGARGYGWLRWRAAWSPRLHGETVVSFTRLVPRREVDFLPRYPDGVEERRALWLGGFRQELDWGGTEYGLRAGIEVQHGTVELDYAFRAPIAIRRFPAAPEEHADTGTTALVAAGTAVGAHLAPRVRLGGRLDLEAGLRYDHHGHAGHRLLSPRLRGRLDLGAGVALLGSWGVYAQTRGLHELDLLGGERTWRTQRARQATAGIEWQPAPGLAIRAEGYRRMVTQPWPRRLNIELGFEVVPETDQDDVRLAPERARADGLDLEIEGRTGSAVTWHAAYTLARTEDLLGGRWVPRIYDQRHALALDGSWRLGSRWSVAAAWQWHSGWPRVEPDFTSYSLQGGRVIPAYHYAELGRSRLPAYHRLDLRIRHESPLAGGTLGVRLDLINFYNRRNLRGISYDGVLEEDGTVTVRRNPFTLVPFAPVLSLSWGS